MMGARSGNHLALSMIMAGVMSVKICIWRIWQGPAPIQWVGGPDPRLTVSAVRSGTHRLHKGVVVRWLVTVKFEFSAIWTTNMLIQIG